jgi:hypothetical protein
MTKFDAGAHPRYFRDNLGLKMLPGHRTRLRSGLRSSALHIAPRDAAVSLLERLIQANTLKPRAMKLATKTIATTKTICT